MTSTPRRTGNRVAYRALHAWARRAAAVVYRRVEVTGRDHVPADAPVILAANHSNALADIAIIVAKVPEFPHFLAAATWWKRAPARLLFRLGGVLPVHRSRDGGTRNNVSTFAACHDALAEGAHLAIFPEGEMHQEPALLPLKTGAARIGLGAVVDAKVADVVIVPVGLLYEDRGRFRSDAEIHFGEPLKMDAWADLYRRDPATAVRAVTDALHDALADVTVQHASREEAGLVTRAVAMTSADGEGSFAHRNELRRRVAAGVALVADGPAAAHSALADAVERHACDLRTLDLTDTARLDAVDPHERVLLQRSVIALAPVAAFGVVANGPVVLLVGAAGRSVPVGWQATTKGVGGTLLVPLLWGAEYALLARRIGRRRAAALTTAGALSGWVALGWLDRRQRLRALRRVERLEAERPAELAAARASRADLAAAVEELAGRA